MGSYLTGIAMVHFGLNWLLALVLGVVFALLVGAAVGYLAIRTRGIYFSMVTLALGQILYYIFYKADHFTGGENGLRGIKPAVMEIAGSSMDKVWRFRL